MSDTTDTDETVPTFYVKGSEVFCPEFNDEVVAKIDGDDITVKRGFAKYRDAIEAAVDAHDADEQTPATDEKPKQDDQKAMKSTKPAKDAKPAKSERVAKVLAERDEKPDGVIEEGRIESAKFKDDVQDDLEFASSNKNVPQPPKKNPKFGDKTPAYVEWLKEYRADKYAAKFGIERTAQRVPIYDDNGNLLRHEIRDIGARKVHTTEKIERDPALEESMDWNA